MSMGLFSHTVLGVDIGHSSVKVVGVKTGKHPEFVGCKEITMDPKYLQKEGFDNHQLIGKALREAMSSATPRTITADTAYAVVSEALLFRKVLELPVLPPEELGEAVRLASVEYFPQGIENVEVSYQVLRSPTENGLQEVMVVGMPRKIVADYIEVFRAAKLKLKVIEPKPSALARALVISDPINPILVLDLGSEMSTISVCKEGSIWAASTVNTGGNIIRDPGTHEVVEEKKVTAIKRLTDSLSDELDHIAKFYGNRSGDNGLIKSVLLTGGGSMIEGVEEELRKVANFTIELAASRVTLPAICDRRFEGALGGALYSCYGTD